MVGEIVTWRTSTIQWSDDHWALSVSWLLCSTGGGAEKREPRLVSEQTADFSFERKGVSSAFGSQPPFKDSFDSPVSII